MKLVPFFVTAMLALTGVAHADDVQGPDDQGPADPFAQTFDQPGPRERPRHHQQSPELRRLLVERFDANGDGRLEPRERRHAVRALRKLERKLARQDGDMRGRRLQKLIRKYDMNGDGNVGPGEMPPAMAKRMRRMDRNGDGWVDQSDLNNRR